MLFEAVWFDFFFFFKSYPMLFKAIWIDLIFTSINESILIFKKIISLFD
jgi:hypothetical protein